MLDEGGRDLVAIGSFRHLEVQHLQHPRAAQVEAKRLARRLDETDDLAVLFGDVDERLLRQRQQRRKRGAQERPQPCGGRPGLAQANVFRPVHLLDSGKIEEAGGAQLHRIAASRTNSRCRRRSLVSSGWKQSAMMRPWRTATACPSCVAMTSAEPVDSTSGERMNTPGNGLSPRSAMCSAASKLSTCRP